MKVIGVNFFETQFGSSATIVSYLLIICLIVICISVEIAHFSTVLWSKLLFKSCPNSCAILSSITGQVKTFSSNFHFVNLS